MGCVMRRGGKWCIRYYDASGKQRWFGPPLDVGKAESDGEFVEHIARTGSCHRPAVADLDTAEGALIGWSRTPPDRAPRPAGLARPPGRAWSRHERP